MLHGTKKVIIWSRILDKKGTKKHITNFTGISERLALLQLKFVDLSLSIIQTFAPTDNLSERKIQKMYNDLTKAHELADERVLVTGDFNAKIGLPKTEEYPILGEYGYGIRNKRGTRLIEYALDSP